MSKKPHVGYEKRHHLHKTKATLGKKEKGYLSSIIISGGVNKVSIAEKIIKFIIYIALRLVIRPKHWKDPKKNYEIIDRTYSRIMSADFIYIPSSIAFYIIMAFMPIMSLIMALDNIGFIRDLMHVPGTGTGANNPEETYVEVILGKFIPGIKDLLGQIKGATTGDQTMAAEVGAWAAIVLSLFISTWIAAGGFAKLVFTQSYIYQHKYVGGYWMNKIKGLSMVVSFTLYLLIALTINIGFEHLMNYWNLTTTTKDILRYVFLSFGLFFLIFIGFIILYRFSPRFKTKIRWIIPGAMTSTIPTAGFLILFGSISSLWSYGKFGSIGTIMYIGMGALMITYFIFVGILVNSSYHNTHIGKVEKKWTFSRK